MAHAEHANLKASTMSLDLPDWLYDGFYTKEVPQWNKEPTFGLQNPNGLGNLKSPMEETPKPVIAARKGGRGGNNAYGNRGTHKCHKCRQLKAKVSPLQPVSLSFSVYTTVIVLMILANGALKPNQTAGTN